MLRAQVIVDLLYRVLNLLRALKTALESSMDVQYLYRK